jgi:Tol biopolymer transport system component
MWTKFMISCLVTIANGHDQRAAAAPNDSAASERQFLVNPRQLTFDGECGEGYFSPDGKRIVFQSIRGEHPFYQIYVKDLESGREQMVSTGFGRTSCSYFHPHKPRILYASSHLDPNHKAAADAERLRRQEIKKNPPKQRSYTWVFDPYMDIFEADLDGANLRRLTDSPGYDAEAAYSSDGNRIVFCSFRDGNGEIYVMDADGSNSRRLTHSPGYDGGPFFSPDGKRIVYRGEAEKPDYLQIYLINSDGSAQRRLTHNEAVNWGPYWHPDGRHIIFATSLHGHHNYELYWMNVETGAMRRVTYTPGADVLPVFDRDGAKLMWTSRRGKNRLGETSSHLWIADWVFREDRSASAAPQE